VPYKAGPVATILYIINTKIVIMDLSRNCNTIPREVVTVAFPCGMQGVLLISHTRELTQGRPWRTSAKSGRFYPHPPPPLVRICPHGPTLHPLSRGNMSRT